MQFTSLKLQGFKKYLDHGFDFKSGLNIFVGPNEAGKTTLHQALVTALYGFGSKSAQLLRNKDEAKHWFDKGKCNLGLQMMIKDEQYRILRDITNGTVLLQEWDETEGGFVTRSEDAKKIAQFVADATGIPSPDVFNQSISIQQNQMANLEDLEQVGEAIEAIFSGDEKISIEKVFENLNTVRKNLKKNPREKPGKIDLMQERLAELTEQLRDAYAFEKDRKELNLQVKELSTRLPKREKRLAELGEFLEKASAKSKLQTELDALRKRYKEVDSQLKKIEMQREEYESAKIKWQSYEKISKQEENIEPLRHAIMSLENILDKIDSEVERLEEERGHMNVFVMNNNIFLSPKALWGGVSMIVAGFIAFALLKNYWMLGISAVGLLWSSANIITSRMVRSQESKLKSDLLIQLEQDRDEKTAHIKELLHSLGLEDEALSQSQELFLYLDNYYRVKEAFQRSTGKLDLLLEDVDVKKLEKEREDLHFDGNMVKKGLEEFEGFDPTAEEVHLWEKEKQDLAKSLPDAKQQFSEAQGRLKQMQQSGMDFVNLESEKEFLESQIEVLSVQHEASVVAIEILEQVVSDYRAEFLPLLQQKSSEYFAFLTKGRYHKISITNSWPEIKLPVSKDFDAHKGHLSQGSLDQLFFALRLAAVDLMSKDISLPLILDDPFVHFDDERYAQAIELMGQIAQERQVIYFASRKHIHEDLKKFVQAHEEANLVEMKR